MCRYIYADQVIGTTFIELLKQNIMEISLHNLFKVERKLDKILRERNNTIICMSIKDVYYTVDNYKRIFEISNDTLKLINNNDKSHHQKEDILELLDDYFIAGLPHDISETMNNQVKPLLGVNVSGEMQNI